MAVMTVKAVLPIALLITVAPAPASAQLSRRTFGGLPFWADSALVVSGLGQRFMLSSELNTIYEFGDFDRDGLLDVAVEIEDTGGLRYGIAIVHRIDRSVHVVGAGQPIGNGKDQLNWRASWALTHPDTCASTPASAVTSSTSISPEHPAAGLYGTGATTCG